MGATWLYGIGWLRLITWVWELRHKIGVFAVAVPMLVLIAIFPTAGDLFLSYRRFCREEDERAASERAFYG